MKKKFCAKDDEVCLCFNNVPKAYVSGVQKGVKQQLGSMDTVDVSVFLRENLRLDFLEQLSPHILVKIYLSQEDVGEKNSGVPEDVVRSYLERVKTRITDYDVVLAATMLRGKLLQWVSAGSTRLNSSVLMPYGFVYNASNDSSKEIISTDNFAADNIAKIQRSVNEDNDLI
jgi:hypothetical protein